MEVPKKPYKGFYYYVSAMKAQAPQFIGVAKPQWPCYECQGRGKIWDPEGRDDYEGNKLNRRIDCRLCHGTGNLTHNILHEHYVTKIYEPWRKHKEEVIRYNKLSRSAKSKLTPEERKVLGL